MGHLIIPFRSECVGTLAFFLVQLLNLRVVSRINKNSSGLVMSLLVGQVLLDINAEGLRGLVRHMAVQENDVSELTLALNKQRRLSTFP